MDIKNLAIVRQSYANTVFTHKVQEVAAQAQSNNADKIKILNIVITAVVLILLVVQTACPSEIILSYIAAGITVAEVVFLIVQLTFNFDQKSVLHKNSALKYMGLRDQYRLLIADIMNDTLDEKNIMSRRDSLQYQYQVISDLAPQTSPENYTDAQKRLNKRGAISGEEFTWSDEEIDWFLPETLRLKK